MIYPSAIVCQGSGCQQIENVPYREGQNSDESEAVAEVVLMGLVEVGKITLKEALEVFRLYQSV